MRRRTPDDLDATLVLAEYQQLKAEQLARIGTRDNLLYATLAAYAAIVGVALAGAGQARVLLALPAAGVVLGWTYLANDKKIAQIGDYLRADLAGRLREHLPAGFTVFGWESAHRGGAGWRRGKVCQVGVDLLAFCLGPLVALVAFWVFAPATPALLAVSAADAALVVGLAAEVLQWAVGARDRGRQAPAGE